MEKVFVLFVIIFISITSLLVYALFYNATSSKSFNNGETTTIYQSFSEGINTNMTNSINSFGLAVYKQIVQQNQSNIIFSPLSLFLALSMAARGADGQTLMQFRQAMQLPSSFGTMDSNLSAMLESLKPSNNSYILSIADSLWFDKKFNATYRFNQSFIHILSSFYKSSAYPVDFVGNPDGATELINAWVAKETGNMIKNILTPGSITPDTVAVIINAIYFFGLWQHGFDVSSTTNATFNSYTGNVTVPMMQSEMPAGYYQNSSFQALGLAYKNSSVSMLLILPNNSISLENVTEMVVNAGVQNIMNKLRQNNVFVKMPKFNFSSTFGSLINALENLGIKDAFVPYVANFSNMYLNHTGNETLYIYKVLQKAGIKVNESGTVAAASTVVIEHATLAAPSLSFIANRPFVFFIVDHGIILFMGQVTNPAISS
ncbi:MAG: serpin family protein [Candidatus Micrarchaeia archaeon]